MNIKTIFYSSESHSIERKESASRTLLPAIKKTICAIANDLPNTGHPGYILIGVHDDGTCANIDIDDQLLLILSQMKNEILPFPSIQVTSENIDDCKFALIRIEPSRTPPLRYKGTIWVRIGPSTHQASLEDERQLAEKRRYLDIPYDIHPVATKFMDEIDKNYFESTYLATAIAPEVIKENSRTYEERLVSLRFIDTENTPTVVGIMTCGITPRDFIPGFYVQFLRINGTELSDDISNQREIDGRLEDILRRVDDVIEANIQINTEYQHSNTETKNPDYPKAAIQQILRNAILHRNYETSNTPVKFYWFNDRIEIISPGGPFGMVTKETFARPGLADYRNPNLAEAMKNLGYVQKFGSGFSIAEKTLRENGNPPLRCQVENTFVLVTLWRNK